MLKIQIDSTTFEAPTLEDLKGAVQLWKDIIYPSLYEEETPPTSEPARSLAGDQTSDEIRTPVARVTRGSEEARLAAVYFKQSGKRFYYEPYSRHKGMLRVEALRKTLSFPPKSALTESELQVLEANLK